MLSLIGLNSVVRYFGVNSSGALNKFSREYEKRERERKLAGWKHAC